MDVSGFLASFPEFGKGTALTLVGAKLAEATLQVSPSVWGALTDTGIGYLTAHLLALSPSGQNARMVAKDGVTTYFTHYRRLQRMVSSGFRVTA